MKFVGGKMDGGHTEESKGLTYAIPYHTMNGATWEIYKKQGESWVFDKEEKFSYTERDLHNLKII